MASPFPIYALQTGSQRNARESNAILGLNAHSSFNGFLGWLIEKMAEVGTRSSMTSNHEIIN